MSVFQSARAGEMTVRQIAVANQLPSTNTVYRIFQDRDGFVRLGTYNQGTIPVCPGRISVVNCDLQFIKAET
ncbi:MAG: hypothetical protein LBC19_03110 [Tannerella sp.]|nr:hypothetical protein [Tannerella sp.]